MPEADLDSDCGAQMPRLPGRDARLYVCDLPEGHDGPHNDFMGLMQWPAEAVTA